MANLNCLPSSLQVVRSTIKKEIQRLREQLDRKEREFYRMNENIREYLCRYSKPIKHLMKSVMVNNLQSAEAVRAAIQLSTNQKTYFGDQAAVELLKEGYGKVHAASPSAFMGISESLKQVREMTTKYCRSFLDPDTKLQPDTACYYENQIKGWGERIKALIKKPENLYFKFKTRMLSLNDFSSEIKYISHQYDCEDMLFLLMFPEVVLSMKLACDIVVDWLKSDEEYMSIIDMDCQELEQKKGVLLKVVRRIQEAFSTVSYQLLRAETEEKKIMQDLERLKKLEEEVSLKGTKFSNREDEIRFLIGFKRFRLKELWKTSSNKVELAPEDCKDILNCLLMEIGELKQELPLVEQKLTKLRPKLQWFAEKKKALMSARKKITYLQKKLEVLETDKKQKVIEWDEVASLLAQTRNIYKWKTSPDTMKKILFNAPGYSQQGNGEIQTNDPVHMACIIVSQHIDKDWYKLYRMLPFEPRRGLETIEHDIQGLVAISARRSHEEQARVCLNRWRHYHSQPTVSALCACLETMNREDICQTITEEFGAKANTEQKAKAEQLPAMELELIPFYRQVERYDQLQASKKKEK